MLSKLIQEASFLPFGPLQFSQMPANINAKPAQKPLKNQKAQLKQSAVTSTGHCSRNRNSLVNKFKMKNLLPIFRYRNLFI